MTTAWGRYFGYLYFIDKKIQAQRLNSSSKVMSLVNSRVNAAVVHVSLQALPYPLSYTAFSYVTFIGHWFHKLEFIYTME